MVDLLTSLIQDRTGKTFAQRVLKAFQAEHRKKDPSEPDILTEPRFFEQPPHHILTRREIEILPLLAEGLSNQDIAARLYIAPVTVKKHLQNIYKKLSAKNRLEALKNSREMGIRIHSYPPLTRPTDG
jgi:LuxR family maltose regulon positive regulatory protein